MTKTPTLVLIPARMAATRLPGKPLLDIAGLPMIVHVLRRAEAGRRRPGRGRHRHRRDRRGGRGRRRRVVMTAADHPSGSDRIAEALGVLDPDGRIEIVVNLQGDFPTIRPDKSARC